jgi:hypothetical protein
LPKERTGVCLQLIVGNLKFMASCAFVSVGEWSC